MNFCRPTLIYDGECRLCVFSKKMIEKWDTKGQIRFLPFQKEDASEMIPEIASMKSLDAMRLVDSKGGVSSGVHAFLGMLPALPMGFIVAFILKLPGVSILATTIYNVVAKNRTRWFGKSPLQ